MKPGFALDLDEDHIRLLFRRADGWVKVGEVGFADPKLGDKLAALRQKAGRLAPEGVLTKLVIPSSQILYTEVDAPGPDRRARRAQIMKAIDGRTPYALDELTVDWARSGKHTFVAVVAKLTLDEAEDFAEGFGFNPVSFVAIPESGRFDGEPFFGQTRNAEAHLPAGEPLDRDTAPIRIVGALPDEALEPEPAAGTATEMEAPAADETARLPESGPEEAAEKAPEAATDTPGQDPDRNAETATADEPRPAAMPPASRTPRSETPPSETAPSETAPSETPPSKTAASGTPVAEAPAEHRPEIAPEIAPAIAPDLGRKQSRAEIAAQSLGAVGDRRIAADDDEAPFIEVAEGTADPEPPIAAGASFASRRELRAPLDRGGDGPAPLKGAAASRLTFAEPALPEPVTRRVGPATAKPGVTAPDLAVPEASGADGAEDSQQPPRRNRLGPPIVDVKHEARHGTLAQQKQRRVSELGEDPDTAFTSFGTTRDPRRAGGLRPKLILTLLLLLLLALGAIALWSMRSTTSDPAASLAPARSPLPDAASTGASSGESDLAATTTGDAAPDAAQTESAPAPMAQPSLTAAAPEADAPPEVNPPPAAAETLEAAAPAPAPAPAPAGAASVAPQPEAITGPPPQASLAAPALVDAPSTPGAEATPPVARDAPVDLAQAPAPEAPLAAPLADAGLSRQPLPQPFGTTYDIGPDGLVRPTAEGVVMPDGFALFAGRPPVVPAPRPGSALPEATVDAAPDSAPDSTSATSGATAEAAPEAVAAAPAAADPALATARPKLRPEKIATLAAAAAAQRATIEAAATAALAAEADLAAASPLAVGSSRRPPERPNGFAKAVDAAVAAAVAGAVAEPAAAPAAAPATASAAASASVDIDEPEPEAMPTLPTTVTVSRQATVKNAIDLGKVNLIGVYGSASRKRALVRMPNGHYLKLKVGDRFDGGLVAAIGDSELSYVKGGRTYILKIVKNG